MWTRIEAVANKRPLPDKRAQQRSGGTAEGDVTPPPTRPPAALGWFPSAGAGRVAMP